ncbi:MAG TPA: tautomerase family protein [Thermoanaerobaculia bacterium]|nr:tautomerase family protein [Thermoanaerobaculia bacterium]
MPLVHVHLREGKSPEFHRAICDAVFAALVSEAGAPAESRFCFVHEYREGRILVHPTYGGVARSEDPLLIEVTLNSGRAAEVKSSLYRGIVRNLEKAIDVRPDDVIVSLREVPRENWSFGRGIATYL